MKREIAGASGLDALRCRVAALLAMTRGWFKTPLRLSLSKPGLVHAETRSRKGGAEVQALAPLSPFRVLLPPGKNGKRQSRKRNPFAPFLSSLRLCVNQSDLAYRRSAAWNAPIAPPLAMTGFAPRPQRAQRRFLCVLCALCAKPIKFRFQP